MALIGVENIASNKWDSPGDIPRGFLPASTLGLDPLTYEYVEALNAILANIEEDLTVLGYDNATTTDVKAKRVARAMARYYAAESVLARASVGQYQDLEGNQARLTASDLAMWQKMKDDARDFLNDQMDKLAEPAQSAVWLAEVQYSEPTDVEVLRYQ